MSCDSLDDIDCMEFLQSFYIRCTKDGAKLRCQQDPAACNVNKGRFKCQSCRFQACLAAGMQRKEGTGLYYYNAISNTLLSKCDFKYTYTYLLKVFTPTGAPAGGCKMIRSTVPLLYVSYVCKVRLLTTLKSQMNNKGNNIFVLE